MLEAVCREDVALVLGALWRIEVEVRDVNGYLTSSDAPAVVVTIPAGSTTNPTFTAVSTGRYRALYTVGSAGRYIAHVTTSDDAINLSAYVETTVAATGMPTVDDLLGPGGDGTGYLRQTSATDEQVQDALNAEAAAQRAVCRIGAIYPADLRQALMRRVARNLAMRGIPLAVPVGDVDTTPGILPGRDPEVRRLEGPYRKLVVG